MNTDKQDVAAVVEPLKMAAERQPRSEADQVSQSEVFRRRSLLLEMWPGKPAAAPGSEGVNSRLE